MTDPQSKILLQNHKRFLAFVIPRVESREAAEEILQESYLKALNKSNSLRADERIVAWFYRILRNSIYDHYRSRGAESKAIEKLARELPAEIDESPKLEKAICKCMGHVIETLNPEYSDILKKAELAGKSLKDVARQKGITSINATVRLHRARKSLKKSLIQTCGTCAAHGCLDCSCKHPE